MQEIWNVLNAIWQFLSWPFKLLISFITHADKLIEYAERVLDILDNFIPSLPVWLQAFVMLELGIMVLYLILGRNKA